MKRTQHPLSLESKDSFKRLIKDIFGPAYAPAVEKLRIDETVARIVVGMLDTLPERQKISLCLRYGITNPNQPMKFAEMGVVLGKVKNPNAPIASSRTMQIVARGLRMMRHPFRNERLRGIMDALNQPPNAP